MKRGETSASVPFAFLHSKWWRRSSFCFNYFHLLQTLNAFEETLSLIALNSFA